MRLLLVEDDPTQRLPLQIALRQAGHMVDAVPDAETAEGLWLSKDYDLLIVDWMLPGRSGIELCRRYRQASKGAPVLMLTAKDTTADTVAGLDAGADDYLVKPVDVLELLARVRALGRRSPYWLGDCLTVGDLQLDLMTLTVHYRDQQVMLAAQEFRLMEMLMRQPQRVFSREYLEANLWEWGSEPESNALSRLVYRLRQRLSSLGCGDVITTVHGLGYRLHLSGLTDASAG
ncbi:MAG: response regulator transcription factor [Thermostichus sp. DG_1_6_bins_120]